MPQRQKQSPDAKASCQTRPVDGDDYWYAAWRTTQQPMCRCDVCDGSQDDGRKTVSEQNVQRITSKETAQT